MYCPKYAWLCSSHSPAWVTSRWSGPATFCKEVAKAQQRKDDWQMLWEATCCCEVQRRELHVTSGGGDGGGGGPWSASPNRHSVVAVVAPFHRYLRTPCWFPVSDQSPVALTPFVQRRV